MDGSSNTRDCGVGLLLISHQEGFEYALLFNCDASNNEAEYEVLLAGLRMTKLIGINNIIILSDSQWIVNQVTKEYQKKEQRLPNYLPKVKVLLTMFPKYEVRQISRFKNVNTNSLARLIAAYKMNRCRIVLVEIFLSRAYKWKMRWISTKHIGWEYWIDPQMRYLKDRTLPPEKMKARWLQHRTTYYVVRDGNLY